MAEKKEKKYVIDNARLMAEWDWEKNDSILAPDAITVGNSKLKVNWICSSCNHRWPSTVYNRVHQNSGCPQCGNRRISMKHKERLFNPSKSLSVLFPEIAAEWHPSRNGEVSVERIMPGCNDEVWWLCSTCGNEYPARVFNRTGCKYVGCPTCNKYMHTSFPEQAIFFYIHQIFPNSQNKYTDCFENQMELDVFVPELNMGIEYDGSYWHSDKSIERNKKKYRLCQKAGLTLVRIKENYHRYPIGNDDCDYGIYRENASDAGLADTIVSLLSLLRGNIDIDVDIMRDRSKIKSQYIISFKEKSLLARFPTLATEWHPSKNGTLKPEMIMPSSHDKVWWLCPKCGYEYPAAPSKRTRENPTGCPVCANRVIIPGINDLATLRPDLTCEWHPSKNGNLKPTEIAPNYSKKVWWKCAACGHEYPKTPNKRVSAGQGCTECSKKSVAQNLHKKALRIGVNDLASQHPELLNEWDYEANVGLPYPQDITVGNNSIYINWRCSTCGYKWSATAYSRTHLKTGCKKCGWKKTGVARRASALKKGVNDLASQCPELLKDWDYEKNSGLVAPDEITVGNSKTKVFWKCNICGNEWKTYVYLRVHRNQGCRLCSRRNRKVNPHPSK